MLKIAIVGSAEVVLRAIGNKLEGDIQRSLDRAAKGARSSGRDAGQAYGKGVGEGINLQGGIADKIKPSTQETNKVGLGIGKQLGNQIGKGIERSRLKTSFIRSLLKLAIVVPVIATLIGGISTLVQGLYALVAAAGTASAALVVFPGILAAIAQGAVVATVGFKGVGEAIAAGFDPSKAEQFQQALAKLPPSAQAFVKEFIKFKEEFRGIRAAASEGLFEGPNGLTASLKKIEPLLPRIATGFRETGQAIAASLNSAFDRLTTDNALENFGIVARINNVVIRDLGEAFGDLGATITAVLAAAGPIITEFSGWLATFSANLRESTEAGANDGSLASYFEKAAAVAKVLIDIVGNVIEGLYEVGQIAQPFGVDLLIRLRDLTEGFANFTDSADNVEGLQGHFGAIHDNLLAIGQLAKEVGAAFLRIGASPAIGDVANALRSIMPQLELLLESSLAAAPAFILLVGAIAEFFTHLSNTGGLQVFISIITTAIGVLNTFLAVMHPISSVVAKIVGAVAGLAVGFLILLPVIKGVKTAFALFTIALRLNPIGAVITALTLLALGFKYAWEHSMTFRRTVAKVIQGVVGYFNLLLLGWQKVLGALGKVPGFGWAKTASVKIEEFRGSITRASQSFTELANQRPKIDVDSRPAQGKLQALDKANGFVITGKVDLDTRAAAAKLAAFLVAISNPLTAPFGAANNIGELQRALGVLQQATAKATGGGGSGFGDAGSGGGSGSGGKEKKEKKEKEKTEIDMRPVFAAILEDTDKFRDALNSYIEDLRKAGEKDGVNIAMSFKKRMDPFLKALDSARDKIEKFTARVKEIRDGLIDRTNIFAGGDKPSDFNSLVGQLAKSQQETADLAKALAQLRGLGLNDTMVQQLANAGPEGLKQAASIVRSGPQGIAQLNKLQSGIAGAANRAGKEAAASATGAGAVTADAFIKGLVKQRGVLQQQLDILARSMGSQIAATLKKETKPLGFFPGGSPAKISTRTPAAAPSKANSQTININQIYQGPSTGSSRNRELDWTLRYASQTSAAQGGGGSFPIAVTR